MFNKKVLTTLLRNTPIGYAYLNILYDENGLSNDFEFVDINPSFSQITHIDKTILGKSLSDLNKGSEFIGVISNLLQPIVHIGENATLLHCFNSLDKCLYIHGFSADEKGIILQVIDRTKEVLLEKELVKRAQSLEDLFNIIVDLIMITDLEGNIVKVNKSWENKLYYSDEDLVEESFVNFIHDEDKGLVNNYFNNNEDLSEYKVFTSRIRSKTGEFKHIEWEVISYDDQLVFIGRDITDSIEKDKEIRYLSYHDKLTGLYNRAFFEEEIKRLDRDRNLPISIIMGDTNGLKLINDVFGHSAGDRLIKSTADILTKSCRGEDIIARWGGDEFIILLPSTPSEITREIINRIQSHFKVEQFDSNYLNISLGYAVKTDNSTSISDTIREAENDMYRNKSMEGQEVRRLIVGSLIDHLYDGNIEVKHHMERLKTFTKKIGQKLNLPPEDMDKLNLLCEIHDIGNVSLDRGILFKVESLTNGDWKEIKKHPEIGYRIAKSIPELTNVADYILHHHERWDGTGYPHKLKGEEIPLLSRIFTVADSFDAMTQNKPYRKAYSKEYAVEYIKKKSGTKFDPHIVDIFINNLKL